jgi:hypothetical protein
MLLRTAKKTAGVHVKFDDTILGHVFDYQKQRMREIVPPTEPVVFKTEQVINGCDKHTHFGGLDMTTSAGFNCAQTFPASTKSNFFVRDETTLLWDIDRSTRHGQQLGVRWDNNLIDAESGIVPDSMWDVNIKQEILPNLKNECFKSRVVWVLPVEDTMLHRAYFGSFVSAYIGDHGNHNSGVGMNPYSSQWDHVISRMKSVNTHGWDGDYEGFETIANGQMFDLFVRKVNYWYEFHSTRSDSFDKDNLIRAAISKMMSDGQFRANPFFYLNPGMLASGGYLTTIFNTELNETLLAYSFFAQFGDLHWHGSPPTPEQVEECWDVFDTSVKALLYGDDIAAACGPKASFFTQLSHHNQMAKCGVNFTPSTKGDVCSHELKPVEELTFIGNTTTVHHFDFSPNRQYWATPNPKSLLKPITFFKPGLDPNQSFIVACNDAIRRNFPSAGREGFDAFSQTVVTACHRVGIVLVPYTWEECVQKMRPDSDFENFYNEYTDAGVDEIYSLSDRSFLVGREWPTSREDEACGQMDAGGEEASLISLATAAPSATLGLLNTGPEEAVKTILVTDLCKRPGWVPTAVMDQLSTQGVTNTTLFKSSHGFMSYFSRAYRCWSGGLKLDSLNPLYRMTMTCSHENKQTVVSRLFPAPGEVADPGYLPQNGYLPFVSRGNRVGHCSAIVPYKTEFDFTLIPHYEIVQPFTDGMFYATAIVGLQMDADEFGGYRTGVIVSGSDSFRLSYLYNVPLLTVTGTVFNHLDRDYATVPTTLRIEHGALGIAFPLSFSSLARLVNVAPYTLGTLLVTPTTTAVFNNVGAMNIPSIYLTDIELRSMGVPIQAGQARFYDGSTLVCTANCAQTAVIGVNQLKFVANPTSEDLTWVDYPAFTPNPVNMREIVYPSGKAVTVSDFFTATTPILDNIDLPYKLGLPFGTLLVPDSALNNTLPFKCFSLNPTLYPALPTDIYYREFTRDGNAFFDVAPIMDEFKMVMRSEAEGQMDQGVGIDEKVESAASEHVQAYRGGIGDYDQTFVDLASRPQIITRVRWTTAHSVGEQLLQLNLPTHCLVSQTIAAPFNTFRYSSFESIKIRVTMQSNRFQQGMLCLYSVPMSDPSEVARTHGTSLTSQTCVPDFILFQAGDNKTVELDIPWIYPTRSFDSDRVEIDPLVALVQLSVFSVLRVGPEAVIDYVDLTFSCSIVGARFSVPRVDVGAPPVFEHLAIKRRISRIQPVRMAVHDKKDRTRALDYQRAYGQMFSAVLSSLASKAVDFGTNALGQAVKGLMNDKPNDYANPTPVRTVYEPSFAAVEGVTYAAVLDESIGSQYLAYAPPITPGELDFADLCARFSYHSRFTLTTGGLNEDVLFVTELSPTAEVTEQAPLATFQPTLQCFLSLAATFWSCDEIVYRITMVGATGHSVRLAFLSNYGNFQVPEVETYSQFVQFCDFSRESDTVEVRVPWRTPRRKLRVSKGYDLDRSRYAYGSMYTRLVGSLQSTEVLASSVEFIVFVSFRGMKLDDFSTGPIDFTPQL